MGVNLIIRPKGIWNFMWNRARFIYFFPFIVHHMREKEDKSVATITIPFFKAPQCLLDLTSEEKSYENLSHQVIGTSWQVIRKESSQLQPQSGFCYHPRSKLAIEKRFSFILKPFHWMLITCFQSHLGWKELSQVDTIVFSTFLIHLYSVE